VSFRLSERYFLNTAVKGSSGRKNQKTLTNLEEALAVEVSAQCDQGFFGSFGRNCFAAFFKQAPLAYFGAHCLGTKPN
jgi:hypothetical protein